jgi:FHA domain/Domain of unknown function (DUF1707)
MGGMPAEAPTTPDGLRASDEERDQAVSELSAQFAEGRLSHETFVRRMDEALGARDRRQLDRLFTDLPRRGAGAGTLAALRAGLRDRARRGRQLLAADVAALSGAVRDGVRGRPVPPSPRAAAPRPSALYFPPVAPAGGDRGSRYTIGRDSACDLLIEDLSVSRWHARLEHVAGRWILTDLNSTNGTRLNGWRVRDPVLVRTGDRLTFGSAAFVIDGDQRETGPGRPTGPPVPDHAGPGSG